MTIKFSPIFLNAFKTSNEIRQFRKLSTSDDISLGSVAGVEKENQDRVAVVRYFSEDSSYGFRLHVLADGVGGLESGGQCAEIAIASLVHTLINSKSKDLGARMREGFLVANEQVFSKFEGKGASTMSALAISPGNRIIIASVGDSRIYRYNGSTSPHTFERLTEDDTIGNQVALARGNNQVTAPPKGIMGQLTQAVGSGSEIIPEVKSLSHSEGMKYILTSDGFHSVGRENMSRMITYSNPPLLAIDRLSHLARWFGSKDDISCIFISSFGPLEDEGFLTPRQRLLQVYSPSGVSNFTDVSFIVDTKPTTLRQQNTDQKIPKPRRRKKAKKMQSSLSEKEQLSKDGNNKLDSSKSTKATDKQEQAAQQELAINYIAEDE